MDLTLAQQQEALHVVGDIPWGDTENALRVIDEGLAIAMRATRDEFIAWEENAESAGFLDEFSIEDVSVLAPEWRHALVARLIRSIAMAYGVGTDYAEDRIGHIANDADAASTPLRSILASLAIPRSSSADEGTHADETELG